MANGYKSKMVDKLVRKHSNRNNALLKNRVNTKFISSMYGNFTPNILSNTFKRLNIKIAFQTNNNISKFLRMKQPTPVEQNTGIYKISCSDCNSFYLGQTGRPFLKRFKEHLPKNNIEKTHSNFARHLMMSNHNYVNFKTNFEALHICKNGRYMNAIEEFEIYRAFKNNANCILNEQLNFQSNVLYDTAIHINLSDKNGQRWLAR